MAKLQVEKKTESKVLARTYVEVNLEGKAGKLTRKEAIDTVAQELGVARENVAIVRLDGQAGTTGVRGKFYVYETPEAKKRVHPRYLEERTLSKEDREKARQARKKAAAPAPAPEAKK
jgi:ribosomal protein S24E